MSRNPNPIPYPGTPEAKAAGCRCNAVVNSLSAMWDCDLHKPVRREIGELYDAVLPLIRETLLRARADPNAYPCDFWKSETLKNQIDHAADHLLSLKCKIIGASPDDGEPDLPHAITRLAIAAWIERNAK